jgi:hypothetical protein
VEVLVGACAADFVVEVVFPTCTFDDVFEAVSAGFAGATVGDFGAGWISLFADDTSSAFFFPLASAGFWVVSFFSSPFAFCRLPKPFVACAEDS